MNSSKNNMRGGHHAGRGGIGRPRTAPSPKSNFKDLMKNGYDDQNNFNSNAPSSPRPRGRPPLMMSPGLESNFNPNSMSPRGRGRGINTVSNVSPRSNVSGRGRGSGRGGSIDMGMGMGRGGGRGGRTFSNTQTQSPRSGRGRAPPSPASKNNGYDMNGHQDEESDSDSDENDNGGNKRRFIVYNIDELKAGKCNHKHNFRNRNPGGAGRKAAMRGIKNCLIFNPKMGPYGKYYAYECTKLRIPENKKTPYQKEKGLNWASKAMRVKDKDYLPNLLSNPKVEKILFDLHGAMHLGSDAHRARRAAASPQRRNNNGNGNGNMSPRLLKCKQ